MTGDRSPEDWLARETGTSKSDARRTLATGRQLNELPATAGAAKRGELSAKQAEAVADAADAAPDAEERLLDSAKRKGFGELLDDCRRTRHDADPNPEATARRMHAKRSYRTWTDADGTGNLMLSGPAAAIARMDNAIRHRADRFFREARKDGRREPSEAYGFDAAEVLLTRTGGDDDAPSAPKGSAAKIIVRVDHSALQRGITLDGELCEIVGFGPVPVSTVQEWMADAFIAAILTKGTEIQKVVHLGRKFTAVQQTVLQWQDPVCANRGCNNRLGLEYDHLEDWADTHTTRTEAAKRFCRACHRLKTLGWSVGPPDEDGKIELIPPDDDRHPLQVAARRARASSRSSPRTESGLRRRRRQAHCLDAVARPCAAVRLRRHARRLRCRPDRARSSSSASPWPTCRRWVSRWSRRASASASRWPTTSRTTTRRRPRPSTGWRSCSPRSRGGGWPRTSSGPPG